MRMFLTQNADVIGLVAGGVFLIAALVAAVKACRADPYLPGDTGTWSVVAMFFVICALSAAFLLPSALLSDAHKHGIYISR